MFINNDKQPAGRGRGRPAGQSEKGRKAKQALYEVALRQMGERGFEATTLRSIAKEAGVSPALMYRYFPDKSALVLELYDQLSLALLNKAESMPMGRWSVRFEWSLQASLDVLRPHRLILMGLISILVSSATDGLFSERTVFSRERVQAVFKRAIEDASDAPGAMLASSLSSTLYLIHLALILFWLLDRSHEQRATETLCRLMVRLVRLGKWTLALPAARSLLRLFDRTVREGLFGEKK